MSISMLSHCTTVLVIFLSIVIQVRTNAISSDAAPNQIHSRVRRDWVDDAGNWFDNAGKDVKHYFDDDAKDWFEKAGKDIDGWVDGAGDDIEAWGKEAGHDIETWTKKAKKDIGKELMTIGAFFESTFEVVGKELETCAEDIKNTTETKFQKFMIGFRAVTDGGDLAKKLQKGAMYVISKLKIDVFPIGQVLIDLFTKPENLSCGKVVGELLSVVVGAAAKRKKWSQPLKSVFEPNNGHLLSGDAVLIASILMLCMMRRFIRM